VRVFQVRGNEYFHTIKTIHIVREYSVINSTNDPNQVTGLTVIQLISQS